MLLQGVHVPNMYTDLTTPRVLIMEWVDGTRLRSSAQGGGGREELQMVEIGVRCSLEQMLEEGYYHSDPHPGNLFKMRNGKLAYIDFGMMGEIQGSIRRCGQQMMWQRISSACLHLSTQSCLRLCPPLTPQPLQG